MVSVLDPLWGRITQVTVNPAQWPVVPRKASVAGHVVQVGSFRHEQDKHELLLLSSHVGRWNLLVVPPRTPPAAAAWLMAVASEPRRTVTASSLVADGTRTTAIAEADRAGEAVWGSERGHGRGAFVIPARDQTVTEAAADQPERG
ncbi:hypothetical protein BZZ08_00564 [Streptomyces sp. MH60]|nr:hypothetical protein BZZ08_00564 [Streptomyces sp. MH60]